MTLRQTRNLIRAVTAVALAMAGWCSLCTIRAMTKGGSPPSVTAAPLTDNVAPKSVVSIAVPHDLARVRLRRPLRDALPPAPKTVDPPAPLNLTLVGTVIDASNPQAILKGADGRVSCRGLGQVEAGAEVVAVERNRVSMRYQDRIVVLPLPESK